MTAEAFTAQVKSLIPIVVGVVLVSSVLISVLSAFRNNDNEPTTTNRETIRRNSEWCEIVDEHDDGYGVAVSDIDNGVSIKSFNEADEVYKDVWLSGEELADVADALSVRAAETAEPDGKWQANGDDS